MRKEEQTTEEEGECEGEFTSARTPSHLDLPAASGHVVGIEQHDASCECHLRRHSDCLLNAITLAIANLHHGITILCTDQTSLLRLLFANIIDHPF